MSKEALQAAKARKQRAKLDEIKRARDAARARDGAVAEASQDGVVLDTRRGTVVIAGVPVDLPVLILLGVASLVVVAVVARRLKS